MSQYSQSGDYHVRAEEPATLAEWVRREGQAAVASLPESFFGEAASKAMDWPVKPDMPRGLFTESNPYARLAETFRAEAVDIDLRGRGAEAAAYRRCADQIERVTRGESLPEWPVKGGQP